MNLFLLLVTKLGGRHPVTGRKVIEGVGGGSKQKASLKMGKHLKLQNFTALKLQTVSVVFLRLPPT